MSLNLKITNVHAREILDSRGNPTVETVVTCRARDLGAGERSVRRKHRKI